MSKIIGCGSYAPQKILTNNDLSMMVDTSDEWIIQRTGIERRHLVEEENVADLAYNASLRAIENSRIDKENIDAILVATMTPSNLAPCIASQIKKRLGIEKKEVLAFDLNGACSGFMMAMQVATSLLEQYNTILVVAAETMSSMIDYSDRGTCILFGDGAGSVVLTRSDFKPTFYSFSEHDETNCLVTTNTFDQKITLSMKGNDVFRFAINALSYCINNILERFNYTDNDIDYYICHQANSRILQNVARQCKIDINKFYMNLQEYGNTSSASIPLVIDEMAKKGLLKKGQKVIMCAFGAGLSYSSCLWEIEEDLT